MSATELLAVVAVVLTVVGMAGGALYKAGQLSGRFEEHVSGQFEEHKDDTKKRLALLEAAHGSRITREELDARFGEMKAQLDGIRTLLEKLVTGG